MFQYNILTYDEQQEIYPIFSSNDIVGFNKFMDKHMSQEKLEKWINDNKLIMSLEQARDEMKKFVAILNIYQRDRASINIMEVLIKNYNFVMNDEFLHGAIEKYMGIDILIFINDFVDLSKYTKEISQMFAFMCLTRPDADVFQKFSKIGFDVNELCMINSNDFVRSPLYYAICNARPNVLNFLLDMNVDYYKKYEIDALKLCIRCLHYDHLKLLIEYGADITILKNININEFDVNLVKIYDVLQEYDINPLITALIYSDINESA